MDIYEELKNRLGVEEDDNCLLFANHKERFVKIAFDMYRDKNGTGIWKVEKKNGKEFIVRAKNDDLEEQTDFDVVANKTGDVVTLAFKKIPIMKFAGKDFGFDGSNVHYFSEALRDKIKEPKFVKALLTELDSETKNFLKNELKFAEKIDKIAVDSTLVALDDDKVNLIREANEIFNTNSKATKNSPVEEVSNELQKVKKKKEEVKKQTQDLNKKERVLKQMKNMGNTISST